MAETYDEGTLAGSEIRHILHPTYRLAIAPRYVEGKGIVPTRTVRRAMCGAVPRSDDWNNPTHGGPKCAACTRVLERTKRIAKEPTDETAAAMARAEGEIGKQKRRVEDREIQRVIAQAKDRFDADRRCSWSGAIP